MLSSGDVFFHCCKFDCCKFEMLYFPVPVAPWQDFAPFGNMHMDYYQTCDPCVAHSVRLKPPTHPGKPIGLKTELFLSDTPPPHVFLGKFSLLCVYRNPAERTSSETYAVYRTASSLGSLPTRPANYRPFTKRSKRKNTARKTGS